MAGILLCTSAVGFYLLARWLLTRGTLDTRLVYWRTALSIASDHPVLGVGLDRYVAYYPQYRSQAAVREFGPALYVDAAHNVPLQLLVGGGISVLAAYAALVALVGVTIIQALRRLGTQGAPPLVLASLGGSWLAYQVQSLVSIDQPPLAFLHFVLAGAVLGHANRTRPGRLVAVSASATGPLLASACILAIVVVYTSTLPLRAELALRQGDLALRAGQTGAALDHYGRAAHVTPWDPRAEFFRAQLSASSGETSRASEAFRHAATKDPRRASYQLAAAVALQQRGERDVAVQLARDALELDPLAPDVATDVALVLISAGRQEEGLQLLTDVVDSGRPLARTWAGLGDIRLAAGDIDGAREAYRRAVALDPDDEAIASRLAGLQPQ